MPWLHKHLEVNYSLCRCYPLNVNSGRLQNIFAIVKNSWITNYEEL